MPNHPRGLAPDPEQLVADIEQHVATGAFTGRAIDRDAELERSLHDRHLRAGTALCWSEHDANSSSLSGWRPLNASGRGRLAPRLPEPVVRARIGREDVNAT